MTATPRTDETTPPVSPFAGEPADHFFGLPMPMAAALNLTGTHIGGHRAQTLLPPHPAMSNSRGDVHGGLIATLLDCTLAAATRAHDPGRYGVATIDLTLHYLSPGRGALVGRAVCERRGRSVCFARGEAVDADGNIVAMATGSFKLIDRTPASA